MYSKTKVVQVTILIPIFQLALLDQNGQSIYWTLFSLPKFSDYFLLSAQCCLGGYGGEEKLPNPNYIQGRKISEADDSSFMLEDIAPFAE